MAAYGICYIASGVVSLIDTSIVLNRKSLAESTTLKFRVFRQYRVYAMRHSHVTPMR